eukprot:6203025-Pleurochrysis_carterae.AAC.1
MTTAASSKAWSGRGSQRGAKQGRRRWRSQLFEDGRGLLTSEVAIHGGEIADGSDRRLRGAERDVLEWEERCGRLRSR